MTITNSSNSRIAKNTIMLYFRMLFLMLISLYTSRVILKTLGVEDFGIYNVVGGFVAFLGFLNGAISSSTSRYITFALGKAETDHLKKVFSTCLLTHLAIAAFILLFAETIGMWFVLNKLTIPESRISAAIWVYQCSIISSLVMILSVPYNACIIAHEKMTAFAYISIIEAIAKLIIVYILMLGLADNLILYATLLLAVQLVVRNIYTWYCHRHFAESRFHFVWDKNLFSEILSFAGWSLWGNLAGALFTHGVNIVLNMFFGPVVNAARGIAVQVQSTVQMFAVNFQTAINPQITKSYATDDLKTMHSLIFRSTRFTFFLLLCLSLPIITNTGFILSLWLGQVPDYSIVFLRLMLLICIVDAMSNPLMVSASATGKVKLYQSVIGGILLLIVPCAYLSLFFGGAPESVFYVHLTIVLVACAVRLIIIRSMIHLSILHYLKTSILPCLFVGVISCIVSFSIYRFFPEESILSIFISFISTIIIILILGLSRNERTFIYNKVSSIVQKVKHGSTTA